jgi:hypothetical protein
LKRRRHPRRPVVACHPPRDIDSAPATFFVPFLRKNMCVKDISRKIQVGRDRHVMWNSVRYVERDQQSSRVKRWVSPSYTAPNVLGTDPISGDAVAVCIVHTRGLSYRKLTPKNNSPERAVDITQQARISLGTQFSSPITTFPFPLPNHQPNSATHREINIPQNSHATLLSARHMVAQWTPAEAECTN